MSLDTLTQAREHRREEDPLARSSLSEWLLAMGPVVHRLDYGGRLAALGCADPAATALLAAAYPLASIDAIDTDPATVEAARHALGRTDARARCELEVGGAEVLRPGSYDLVSFLGGLTDQPDPIGAARAALGALRPTGALMVVEHSRSDTFFDGPVTIGGWLVRAGAARVRLAAATPHGFVLDARPIL